MRKLLKRFRLKMEKGRPEYYEVLVYSEARHARNRFREVMGGKWSAYGWDAITAIYDAYDTKTNKLTPRIGEILFYKDRLDDEIVAHEVTHAVNWYMNLRKVNWNIGKYGVRKKGNKRWNEQDERHAELVGRAVGNFWKKYRE